MEENILVTESLAASWFAHMQKKVYNYMRAIANIANLLEAKKINGTMWFHITIDDLARLFAIFTDYSGTTITHI